MKALKNLEAVVVEAKKLGYVGYEFHARLEMGRIEMRSGQSYQGRARLNALREEARARGFLLIAREAGTLEAEP